MNSEKAMEALNSEPLAAEDLSELLSMDEELATLQSAGAWIGSITVATIVWPVLCIFARGILLPWLSTAVRYSELLRQQVNDQIEAEYRKNGGDPAPAKRFAQSLIERLESTKSPDKRAAWERLMQSISLRLNQNSTPPDK